MNTFRILATIAAAQLITLPLAAQFTNQSTSLNSVVQDSATDNNFDFPNAVFEGYEHTALINDQFIYVAGSYKASTFSVPTQDVRGVVVRVPIGGTPNLSDVFFTDGGIRILGISEDGSWVCGSDSNNQAVRFTFDDQTETFGAPDTMNLASGSIAFGINNNGDTTGSVGTESFFVFGGEDSFILQGATSLGYDITQGSPSLVAGSFIPQGSPFSLPVFWDVVSQENISRTDVSNVVQMGGLNELRAISPLGNVRGGVEGQSLFALGTPIINTQNKAVKISDFQTDALLTGSIQAVSDIYNGPIFAGGGQFLNSTDTGNAFIGEGNKAQNFDDFKSDVLGFAADQGVTAACRHLTIFNDTITGEDICVLTTFGTEGTKFWAFRRDLIEMGTENFQTLENVAAKFNDADVTVDIDIISPPGTEISNVLASPVNTSGPTIFGLSEISFNVETINTPATIYFVIKNLDLSSEAVFNNTKAVSRFSTEANPNNLTLNVEPSRTVLTYTISDQDFLDTNTTIRQIGSKMRVRLTQFPESDRWVVK